MSFGATCMLCGEPLPVANGRKFCAECSPAARSAKRLKESIFDAAAVRAALKRSVASMKADLERVVGTGFERGTRVVGKKGA